VGLVSRDCFMYHRSYVHALPSFLSCLSVVKSKMGYNVLCCPPNQLDIHQTVNYRLTLTWKYY
jgi:hypothetical protein